MIGFSVAVLIVLAQAPAGPSSASSPAALVKQLGARRYAEREAATAALEKLGREALPALREARDHKDPEIRAKATALTEKIEGTLLTLPTMVTLEYHDAPLTEVVKQLGTQAGVHLMLFPENPAVWKAAKVSLTDPKPVAFWVAMDRLCDAARLQYRSGMGGIAAAKEPSLALTVGTRVSGPVSYQGPFRVSVTGLRHHRDLVFQAQGRGNGLAGGFGQPVPPPPPVAVRADAGKPNSTISEQFVLSLHVEAEPRLSLSTNRAVKILEAVDDDGNSLAFPQQNGVAVDSLQGYQMMPMSPVAEIQVPLVHPPRIGGTIKRIKGQFPVSVSTRKATPLVVPLSDSAGKTFQNEDVVLTIHAVKFNPVTHQTQVELSARPNESQTNPGMEMMAARNSVNQQQLAFVDAKSRPIPWNITGFGPEPTKIMLSLPSQDASRVPTHLHYFGLAKTSAEVAFEFHDLPMP